MLLQEPRQNIYGSMTVVCMAKKFVIMSFMNYGYVDILESNQIQYLQNRANLLRESFINNAANKCCRNALDQLKDY